MDHRRALLVDAFTDTALTGNAAGVIPSAEELAASQMAGIARELAVSETAFLQESDVADRGIRYFTPQTEVDLCGHATIASHAHLFEENVIAAGTHSLETGVGVIDVEVTEEGVVWMTQETPRVEEVTLDADEIASALGVPRGSVSEVELPTAVASTGLDFLIIPMTFLEPLGDADLDFEAIGALAASVDAMGVYAFSFDTISADATLHGRCFVPGAGIDEDPVTGTASGAVGAYLRSVNAFDSLPETMRFEQGHFLDRPGEVLVQAHNEIRVGGTAVTALDGEISVPAGHDDDIITT